VRTCQGNTVRVRLAIQSRKPGRGTGTAQGGRARALHAAGATNAPPMIMYRGLNGGPLVTHFAYGRSGLAPVLALAISGALGCTAGVRPSGTGSGGSSPTTGAGGSGATGGSATGTGGFGTGGIRFNTGGDVGIGGSAPNPDAAACQQMEIPFKQTNPTVYLLVDRSGSMFHCLTGSTGDAVCSDPTNTSWTHLKTAIEQVLPTLDSQVRFGFTTVWGTNPVGGGMCPPLQGMLTDNVSPALNNAAAIKTKYDSLAFPPNSTQMGIKFESPAS